jgi:phosphosulfolactate phosphohydrolase-like enzyme
VNLTRNAHRQLTHSLRLEWGPTGAEAIGSGCHVAAVVDVLSFTTTLTVAADRGTLVYPYQWHGESTTRFAAEREAVLAVGRWQAGDKQPGEPLPGDRSGSVSIATSGSAITRRIDHQLPARQNDGRPRHRRESSQPARRCDDVDTAAQLDQSQAVPVLEGAMFVPR